MKYYPSVQSKYIKGIKVMEFERLNHAVRVAFFEEREGRVREMIRERKYLEVEELTSATKRENTRND